jgi:phosphoglycerate dehydrogenase-like enzyme
MKIVEIEPIFSTQNNRELFESFIMEHEFVSYPNRPATEQELFSRMMDADAIIISNIPVPKTILENCKNLKMISVAFTGTDHIDMDYCKQAGIMVKNAAGYSTQSVTLGLIIDLLRKITELDKNTRDLSDRKAFVGLELRNKTVGIIGAGAIGTKVGEILHTLGCNVCFTSRNAKPNTFWGTYTSLDKLLKQSDIITLHTPLNSDSENLINRSTIAKMKDGAFIINTARGKVIDSNALAEALKSGKIAGAAIDVYETEPPLKADHPFLSVPNCILTPHIAYATKEALEKRADIASLNILKWLE